MPDKTRHWDYSDRTVILLPFLYANSSEHLISTRGRYNNWFNVYTGGWRGNDFKFTARNVVCKDSENVSEELASLKNKDDVLYIRGHGSPGSDRLSSSNHLETITVTQLVSFLDGKLDKSFQGIIKVYACSSGSNWGTSRFFGLFLWYSFSQQFADAMYAAGYTQCRFFGYTESVSTEGVVFSDRIEGGSSEGGGPKYAVRNRRVVSRASAARVEVIPRGKQNRAIDV